MQLELLPARVNKGRHSMQGSEEWSTPRSLFASLDAEFHFSLDPCATAENAKCARFFTKDDDGLQRPWSGRVFVNPPYHDLPAWTRKAYKESQRGALVVCLVPSRTDTEWWHRYATKAEIRWIRGRVQFKPGLNAPFPCCILVFQPPAQEAHHA